MITITAIYFYPVKSCKGISLDSAVIGPRGIAGDREFMIVDGAGKFITQRENARLALIKPLLRHHKLTISAPGMDKIDVGTDAPGKEMDVTVWQDHCKGIDQGEEIARWLTEFTGQSCRLVRFSPRKIRPVDPLFSRNTDSQISFSDGFPFLLISETSLADLNRRLPFSLPVDRFRPNIVISGADAYAEDRWDRMIINGIEFRVAKPCARCVITTIDQEDASSAAEPLRTLAAYRRSDSGKVLFGQNLIHTGSGRISAGDQVAAGIN